MKLKDQEKESVFIIFSDTNWAKISKGPTAEEACTRVIERILKDPKERVPIPLNLRVINISDKKNRSQRVFTVPSSYCIADAGNHSLAYAYHKQLIKNQNV